MTKLQFDYFYASALFQSRGRSPLTISVAIYCNSHLKNRSESTADWLTGIQFTRKILLYSKRKENPKDRIRTHVLFVSKIHLLSLFRSPCPVPKQKVLHFSIQSSSWVAAEATEVNFWETEYPGTM